MPGSPKPASDVPAADEVEVSIFGPGKGEAIAVHLGAGEWMTVDSCRDQSTGENALLTYFDLLGVDVATQVKLVVGTHAHDDHIAGISEIHAKAVTAPFVQSAALTSEEFLASVEADADIERVLRKTVRSEYRHVMEEVMRRKITPPLIYGDALKVLYERPAAPGVAGARVIALSPSDTARLRAQHIVAKGLARADERMTLRAGDPNEAAIALWIEVGTTRVLLGADVTIGPEGCGWKGILSYFQPSERASLFKIPHHGSQNAHHDAVWDQLLNPEPVALVAPYRPLKNPLPTPADVSRILTHSPEAYITAPSKTPAQSQSTQRAGRSLASIARNVRKPWGLVGQVQARKSPDESSWRIGLTDPARQLSL